MTDTLQSPVSFSPPIAEPLSTLQSEIITPEEASQAAAELQAFKTLESRSSRKKRNKAVRIALIVVAVLVVVIVGIIALRAVLMPADTGEQNIVTGAVERGTYLDEVSGNGTLAPYEAVVVTPEIDGTIAELKGAEGDIILFSDEMHTLIGAGASEGSMDAGNLLKPALARGELHCIDAGRA